ncbi:MAG: hypothetical protein LC798_11115 [Chloroflexi bacterium]|nr:hypothetical protein [Chloroflexota bacterium]
MTLTYRGTELRSITDRRWFSLVNGFWGGITVRGEDDIIPGASGRQARPRLADRRIIRLHGFVLGTDEENHRSVQDALNTLFDPTLSSDALTVASPYMGLASGTATIQARVVSYTPVEVVPLLVTEWDIELEAIGSPPDWTRT